MKKLALLLVLFTSIGVQAAEWFDPMAWVKNKIEPGKTIYFAVGSEDKSQLLNKLKEEKEEFEEGQKQFDESIKTSLEKVSVQITSIKKKLEEGNDEFLQKKLSILNESHQAIIDIQLSQKEIVSTIDQQIKVLEEYLKDPEFKALLLEAQSYYSFEHLQNIMQKIVIQDDVIAHLEEQKNIFMSDMENRKKSAEQLVKTTRDKERELKELSAGRSDVFVPEEEAHFDFKQRAELIDQTIKFLANKRRLVDQKIAEIKRKIGLIDTKIFVAKEQRKILDEQRLHIKEGLRVDESDIHVQRQELEKKKRSYLEVKESYYQQRKNLSSERDRLRGQIGNWANKLGITVGDLRDLDEMVITPATAQDYLALGVLLSIKEEVLYLDKQIEFLDAEINAEEAKFERDSIATDIVDSWHKITMRKFRSEENVESEIRKYQDPLMICERELLACTEKRNTATNFLAIQNKVSESLKNRIKILDENRLKIFNKHLVMDFVRTRNSLIAALSHVNDQIEVNRKIIEVYSNTINIRSNSIKQINTIIAELKSIGPRAASAISWEGIKNIPADIELFWSELASLTVSFFKQFAPSKIVIKVTAIKLDAVGRFIVKLLLLLLFFFFLQMTLPGIAQQLSRVQRDMGSVFYVARLLTCIINFFLEHFKVIATWLVCYWAVNFDVISDIFIQILFYLLSIPLFIYLGQRFIEYFVYFNASYDNLFFTRNAYERLKVRINTLLYATAIIFFFREAFMLAIYSKSDLPTILLTIYSIIVRLILISLIRKEDILDLIPTEGETWQWVRSNLEEHFQALFGFLVVLIIMSEPHIGYGKYISYILWGVVGTFILIRILMFTNLAIRRFSTVLFFNTETEMRRERFTHARTAYGIFIMSTFIICATVGFLIGARLWGYTITVSDLSDAMHKTLFTMRGKEEIHEINILSLLQLVTLVVASLFAASIINHFVLRRIFDLLMVEQGVQYTISTIMQYVIVIVVMLVGFKRIGLDFVILPLTVPLLLGLGWATKEYANDFVSYFILLVQRPFKIGDLIKIGEDTQGVVRRITPRAVILRVKNSYAVVIPNSKVVGDQISNWNYSRTFIAINDILMVVPFASDPAEVKMIIARVVDANMHILKNPRPIVWLHDFSERGFVFLIRPFLSSDNVSIRDEVASDIRFAITKSLRDQGINVSGPSTLKMVKD